MTEYWPSSFFANYRLREQGQYAAILTKQVWSIKNLIYYVQKDNFFLQNQCENPRQSSW